MQNAPCETESTAPEKTKPVSEKRPRKKKDREARTDDDDKPPKTPIADLYLAVTNAMNAAAGDPLAITTLPAFPRRFHTVRAEKGLGTIIEEGKDGVCKPVDLEDVAQAVLRYVTDRLSFDPEYKWTTSTARNCADFWRVYSAAKAAPAPLLWANEPGLTYHRLPWELAPPAGADAIPLWSEIMARMSNSRAFMLWVGSLFDSSADLQQYVWLFGEGQNGKGAVTRFLARAFGPGYTSQQPPTRDDKFWTSGLIGKRLVVFPDCNNATFCTTGLFKSLTGGDAQRIEEKGEKPYTAHLPCKFMFVSNERPRLSSEKADMRRAIFCELGPISGTPDPAYESRLWEEGGEFLRVCVEVYRAQCPNGGPLPLVDSESLESWVSTVEERLEVAFEESFRHHPEDMELQLAERRYVKPAEFQEVLQRKFAHDERAAQEFRMFIERRYGVKKSMVRVGDRRENRYTCVSMRR